MGGKLTQLSDFYHKTYREGVIAMSAAKKQSMFIITLRSSGLLRCTRNDDEFMTRITATA